jgi:hypothetical protein
MDASCGGPLIDRAFHPRRDRNSANVLSFANQVGAGVAPAEVQRLFAAHFIINYESTENGDISGS